MTTRPSFSQPVLDSRRALLTSDKGREYRLVKQLGRGGEGAAYLLEDGNVAKLYHQTLSDTQISKLQVMVGMCDNELLANTAWPKALLFKKGDSRPSGFLMPFVRGHELHEVYGPASRKQRLPTATWEYLAWVARNAACAFFALHRRNVVVGDVNEKNLFVQDDGRVALVDCDSYQISVNGCVYPCRVGVPLYTPPELQGLHLAQTRRSAEHDTFGLSVLIFQLLFMGRHPFAGITREARFLAIENGDAIKAGLYAYGRNSIANGISPPPGTLPITAVTPEIQLLFERAFGKPENGQGSRPTATQWVQTLESFRQKLVTCRVEKSHRYSNHLLECPWCALAKNTGVHFFICVSFAAYIDVSGEDTAAFRKAINQLVEDNFAIRDLTDFGRGYTFKSNPLPLGLGGPSGKFMFGIFVLVGSFLLCFAIFPLAIWGFMCGISLVSGGWRKPEYQAELSQRRTKHSQCQQQLTALYNELKNTVSGYHAEFTQTKSRLEGTYKSYVGLPQERQRQIALLEQKKRQIQLEAFLDRFIIAKHKIQDIGPAREAMLIAYGVETAADITKVKVTAIPGFKYRLFAVLEQWRSGCERKFVFDPSKPVPQVEIDAMNKKLTNLKFQLQEQQRTLLRNAVDFGNKTRAKVADLNARLEVHSRELKQAAADLAVFSK